VRPISSTQPDQPAPAKPASDPRLTAAVRDSAPLINRLMLQPAQGRAERDADRVVGRDQLGLIVRDAFVSGGIGRPVRPVGTPHPDQRIIDLTLRETLAA